MIEAEVEAQQVLLVRSPPQYAFFHLFPLSAYIQSNQHPVLVDIEKAVILKTLTEKEVAEAIMKIGGLIDRKHLEKLIKRLKVKEIGKLFS